MFYSKSNRYVKDKKSLRFFSNNTAGSNNDIVVIGGGCIGQAITASFLKSSANNRVFLIPSDRTIHKIKNEGIVINGAIDGTYKPNQNFIVTNSINRKIMNECRLSANSHVFLSTKADNVISSLST